MNPLFYVRAVFMNLRLILILTLSITVAPVTYANKDELKLSDLPSWKSENLLNGWEAWLNSCVAFRKKQLPTWIKVCDKANQTTPTQESIKHYFESHFKLSAITNSNGSSEGIITGYYEPVLLGSLTSSDEYKYPVYQKPSSSNLQSLSRKQIENQPEKFENDILLWTNNLYDLFFLHVQGSGRVQLTNGQQKSLVYAGNNGHQYTSIGKVLIKRGEMDKRKVSLTALKDWLNNNSDQAPEVLQQNERYIFFDLVETPNQESGPRGSLNVPLTPQRSIAIDPKHVTLGSPVFLETTLPSANNQPQSFSRLMFAQDTGAAIKGQVRADVFFGQGERAEYLAGNMNQKGKMYLLEPR